MVTPEHHVALVDHLVESSPPVRRIWTIRVRSALLLASSAVGVGLVAVTWPRPDLAMKLRQRSFLIEVGALAAATAITALMALRCAVPGRAPSRPETLLTLAFIAGATITLAFDVGPSPASLDDWRCGAHMVALAVAPWIVLLMAIRRGAPVLVTSGAMYSATASLLFAATALRFACPIDDASHWLLWHLAIVPLATLATTPLAARWLRAWRHG